MEFKVAVKGLIVNQNKILLVKRSKKDEFNPGGITLPGGLVEFGEKPAEAMVREVQEETGLRISVGRVNTVWSFIDDKNNIQIVGITFVCKPLSKVITLSEELLSFHWVNIDYPDVPKWFAKEIKALNIK